jgi:predicted glutamine amidotransferase
MCRLAAFPPGFSREDALEVLADMEGFNRDGVGSAYARPDGRFVIKRYPWSLRSLLTEHKDRDKFLSHMPHDGWTIVHLRIATHGGIAVQNTHPFTAGEWCVVHNGVWDGHAGARLALSNSIKFRGETDSEVAAHLINIVGPKKFAEGLIDGLDYGGVFLALNRNGHLWVLKTSGELENLTHKGATLLASSIMVEAPKVKRCLDGWYHYTNKGKLLDKRWVTAYEVKAEDTRQDYPYHPNVKYTERFGANVYDSPSAGNDEPTQEVIKGGAYGWYCDEGGHWHKNPPKITDVEIVGSDGFPVRPHCTGTPGKESKIAVPRDPDIKFDSYDERGYPRYAAQVIQTHLY